MSLAWRLTVVAVLAGAVGTVVAWKQTRTPAPQTQTRPSPPATGPAASRPATGPATTAPARALPRLLEIGSVSCIPCRRMAPILDQLRTEQAGRLEVEFIDIRTNSQAVEAHNIRLIPTQVFLDAAGKELWRHEGFLAKEDILAKWKELGVSLAGKGAP